MIPTRRLHAIACFSLAVCAPPLLAQSDSSGRAAFAEWAARTALRFPAGDGADVESALGPWIAGLTADARVVGIGEGAHDVHEFLALRALATRSLVERGRVSALVMESGLAESRRIDAWIVGRDSTPPDFEHNLSYGFGQAEEIVHLLRWLQSYNAGQPASRRVHFYGADLPADGGGSLVPALAPVWSYLDSVDAGYARDVRSRITSIASALDTKGYDIVGRYEQLPQATRESLHRALDDLHARFVAHERDYVSRSSADAFAWAARFVEVARQTEANVRLGWNHPSNPRDSAMAANVAWVESRERPRGLVVAWAHNLHVARAPITGPLFAGRGGPPVASMGEYLGRTFGSRYVAIGTSFRTGGPDTARTADPSSVEGALSAVGSPRLAVAIVRSPATGAVGRWLDRPRLMHAETGYVVVRLRPALDALIYVDSVRTADHVPGASASP